MKKDDVIIMLEEIRECVWLKDIPSPTVPEYIEHHESIQKILLFIDEQIEAVKLYELPDNG